MTRGGPPRAQTAQESSSRPYRVTLVHEEGESDQPWVAAVEELPGCSARGQTPEQAAGRIQAAIASWIATALEQGREIPEPRAAVTYSGRLLLRMPRTLHGELTRAAEREGVSLNQLITDVLSSAVNWQGRSDPRAAREAQKPLTQEPGEEGLTARPGGHPERPRSSQRLLIIVLAANFVVVVVAAVVAIAVLISAWI